MKRLETPEVCPVCGEEVPPRSWACPECGADHASGWREGAASSDSIGSTGEDSDYEQFVRDEFGERPAPRVNRLWWITAIVLLIVLVALYALGIF
jgi:hypothetical protein